MLRKLIQLPVHPERSVMKMLSFIFTLLMIGLVWNIIEFAIKAGWGIFKLITSIFISVFILGLVFIGLIYIALPLLVVGAVIYFATRTQK